MEVGGLTPAMRAAALALRVDAVTAEIVSALRDAGVRPILLKGPSIAAWLYADGPARPYRDTDLLLAPEALGRASRALRDAGFREQPGVSSYTWFRRADRSVVDLHDTLFGVEADKAHAWALLSKETETMRIGTLEVETLSHPARLLYVVLHAAQHASHRFEQPRKDLERALRHAGDQPWQEAAGLARRLRAVPTFATGLRLLPDGASLADSMGLGEERPLMLSLREEGGRSLAVTLERLASAPGTGARLRLLAGRLAPPPDYMRWRYPRLAARGRAAPGARLSVAPGLDRPAAAGRDRRLAAGATSRTESATLSGPRCYPESGVATVVTRRGRRAASMVQGREQPVSRRWWVAVLCLLVALAIAGCGGDDDKEASATAPTTPDASASKKPDSAKSGSREDGSNKAGSKKGGQEPGANEPGSSGSTPKEPGTPQKPTEPATSGGTPGRDGRPVGTVPSGAGPTADERAVVRTVREYLRSIARGDGVQACAQLTPEGRRAVERDVARAAPETKGSPCETSIELYQSSYRSAADGVRVTDVSVAGDRAKAVALDEAASLVKRDRTWLIARYGG